MPDLGWSSYTASQEDAAYLSALTVAKTQDESGADRYFVTDWDGNWVGDVYDTADLAFGEINRMRNPDAVAMLEP